MSGSDCGGVPEKQSDDIVATGSKFCLGMAPGSTVEENKFQDDLYDAELSDDNCIHGQSKSSVGSGESKSTDELLQKKRDVEHWLQNELYDAELSDDSSVDAENHSNVRKEKSKASSSGMTNEKKTNKKKKETIKGSIEKVSKIQQSRKSKAQAMQEIRSHSQRLLRDSPITLPYHKPRQHTLSEFLARKKLTVPIPKAGPDGIHDLVKNIELLEEEIEDFYNSDSDAENQIMPENSSKDICCVNELTEVTGDLLEATLDAPVMHVTTASCCDLTIGEKNKTIIGDNRTHSNLTLKESDNIEFEIPEPVSKIGVSSLIDRYIKHNELKDMPEKDVDLNIIEKVTNGGEQNLVNKTIKLKQPGICKEQVSSPSLKLLKLKQALKEQMASKREKSRIKKLEDLQMLEENVELDDLDTADNLLGEDNEFTDSEAEEFDDDMNHKLINSDLIDDEAGESLISDDGLKVKLESDSDTESVIDTGKKMCLVLDSESSDEESVVAFKSNSERRTLNVANQNSMELQNNQLKDATSCPVSLESVTCCDTQSKFDCEDMFPDSDAFLDQSTRNNLCDPYVSEPTQSIMKELLGLCSGEFSSAPNADSSLDGSDIEEISTNLMSQKRKSFNYSDGEESISSKHEVESQLLYDSDENEISKVPKDFLDLEAELSGSDVGEDEEEDDNEEDLDALQTKEADQEDINYEKVQSEIGRIYHKQILDEDTYKLNLYKEVYLEDGELHSDRHRQRKFRWKDTFGEFGYADTSSGDENEAVEEPVWRRERFEREQWLINNSEKLNKSQACTEDIETVSPTYIGPTETVKKATVKRNGSYLLRKSNNLCRIAELTRGNINIAPKTNGNFIFKTDEKKLIKKSNSEPNQIAKRPKLSRSFHSLEDDHKHKSIFHYIDPK